jgi:hypothetical protein
VLTAVAALLGLFIFVYPLVALFIFHGASRDSQAGVVPKPSPLVAFITKQLLKRKLGSGNRYKQAHPAAVAPADDDGDHDGNFTSLAAPAFSGEVTEAAHEGSDDDADGVFTVHAAHMDSDSDDDADGVFTVHAAPEASRASLLVTG